MFGLRAGKGPQIFAIKTTIGQEKAVIDFMMKSRMKDSLKAVLVPPTLRGYIFIETDKPQIVNQQLLKIPHVRGKLIGQVKLAELNQFLVAKKPTEGIEVGDIVEIIDGPFKGEKAKITRVDTAKDEVTLELFESTHPIPIKVHADYIKKIMSGKDEEKEGEEKEEKQDSETEGGKYKIEEVGGEKQEKKKKSIRFEL